MMRQLLIQRNDQFEMVLRHESLLIHICKFESDPFVSHVCEGNRMWTQQTRVWPPLKTVASFHRWEKQRIVYTHRERRVNMALYITYSSTQEEFTKSTQLTVSEIPKLKMRNQVISLWTSTENDYMHKNYSALFIWPCIMVIL